MITEETLKRMENARELYKRANELMLSAGHDIACGLCRSHIHPLIVYVDDLIKITAFNIKLNDPEILDNYRKLLSHKSVISLLGLISRIIEIIKKIRKPKAFVP